MVETRMKEQQKADNGGLSETALFSICHDRRENASITYMLIQTITKKLQDKHLSNDKNKKF
jgi:hypothetical protein